MFCAYTRPRYKVSVYRTIGPLVFIMHQSLEITARMGPGIAGFNCSASTLALSPRCCGTAGVLIPCTSWR